MAVGFPTKVSYVNGDVFSASDINDTNGTINLLTSTTLSIAAGKNAIINGGFDVWQRGTTNVTSALSYTADRWQKGNATHFGISRTTVSDTTNLPFIQYAARMQRTSGSATTSVMDVGYSMESTDAVKFVGRTVTLSFYARKGANYSGAAGASFNFALYTGTGTDQSIMTGYTGSAATLNTSATLTTSMARYSASVTIPTTATEIGLYFNYTPTGVAGANDYVDITGVQLELGSVATSFSRSGGNYQGELAACQRYFQALTGAGEGIFNANYYTSVSPYGVLPLKQTMRIAPTLTVNSVTAFAVLAGGIQRSTTAISLSASTADQVEVTMTTAAATTGQGTWVRFNAAGSYMQFSAEL
jgi:hypothetical protein